MKDKIIVIVALLTLSAFSPSLYADRHHHHEKGLPYGLQKKCDRGEALPPGWKNKYSRCDYRSEEPYYGGYEKPYYGRNVDTYYRSNDDGYYGSYQESYYGGYDDQYYPEDQPATVEDQVGRIIQDVIDLTGTLQ